MTTNTEFSFSAPLGKTFLKECGNFHNLTVSPHKLIHTKGLNLLKNK